MSPSMTAMAGVSPGVATASFHAMSVEIALQGCGVSAADVSAAAAEGEALADWWEDLFSRFRPYSALCRLNAANGEAMPIEPAFGDVLALARDAVIATGGRFDPSVLPSLEAAGYDRDIALVRAAVDAGAPASAARVEGGTAAGVAGWLQVEIDRAAGTVRLPAGMRIDLGGIAKGAFADMLAARLAGWQGGLVDAGGDIRAWGAAPDGGPWRIAIEHPLHPEQDAAVAELLDPSRSGGVATSGVLRRRWGASAHHLIDPRTGMPLAGGFAAVTVLAPTCVAAEVATKALLVSEAGGEGLIWEGFSRALGIGPAGELTMIEGDEPDAAIIDCPLDAVAAGDLRA